jgi:hypothetical protein
MAHMDAESRERFGNLELPLSENEEKLFAHDRALGGIRTLLQTGMRMLVEIETNVKALTGSHTRLYGSLQELAESQKQLAEAQRRTEESLKCFLDRSGNGHSQPPAQ